MNVNNAKRNIPKVIRSLKSNLLFISITSILSRIEANHSLPCKCKACTRLPVAKATKYIITGNEQEHKFDNVKKEGKSRNKEKG